MVEDLNVPAEGPSAEEQPDELEVGWSGADIEEAYLKALQASEELEWPAPADAAEGPQASEPSDAQQAAPETAAAPPASPESLADGLVATGSSAPPLAVGDSLLPPIPPAAPVAGARAAPGRHPEGDPPNVTPAQIVEAVLFVGGDPVTSKRLGTVLGGHSDANLIEQTIDKLNSEYAAQRRPYEIRLGEGGYRLVLRSEYEAVRNKVYGAGPREVRLSQDALEVLALVAYQQPISHAGVEASGKKNAGNLLRQLLRRELVAISRVDKSRDGVQYHTTPRFLSLFGLGNLDELPQADGLNLR